MRYFSAQFTVRNVPSIFLAVLFALASALTITWGTVTRHRIVSTPGTNCRRGDSHGSVLARGLTNPLWWISIFSGFAAYLLQVVALGFGTLLVVQPILVLSLMFTLMLGASIGGGRMSRRDVLWSSVLTIAVIVLVVLGRPLPGSHVPDLTAWWVAVGIGAIGCAVASVFAFRRSPHTISLVMGAVCGIVFGYVAVLSKAVADLFVAGGLPAVLSSWQLYVLALCAVLGTVTQQFAFATGPLERSLPAMKVFEPIVAMILGYVVLGEQFAVSSALGVITVVCALAAMSIATIRLATLQDTATSSP